MKSVLGNTLELGDPDFCQSPKAFDPVDMGWIIDKLVPRVIYPIMTIAYIDNSVIVAPAIGVDDGKRVNPTPHNP